MALSAITLAELLQGAEKSSRPTENLAVVEDFCSRQGVLPYGPKAAMHDGQIRTVALAGGQVPVDRPRPRTHSVVELFNKQGPSNVHRQFQRARRRQASFQHRL